VIRSTQSLFKEEEFNPSTDTFDIELCCTDYVNRVLVSALVPDLVGRAPNARIKISHIQSDIRHQQEILERVDLLLFAHDPMLPNPDGMFLFGDEMVCVSSYRDHKDGQYIALDALCALSHVVGQWALRSSVSVRLTDALRDHGLTRNIALELPDFASVFRMMQSCELVAFLPDRLVSSHSSPLKKLRVDLDIPAAEVFARWHPRLDHDPRHVWLRQRIVDVCSRS